MINTIFSTIKTTLQFIVLVIEHKYFLQHKFVVWAPNSGNLNLKCRNFKCISKIYNSSGGGGSERNATNSFKLFAHQFDSFPWIQNVLQSRPLRALSKVELNHITQGKSRRNNKKRAR